MLYPLSVSSSVASKSVVRVIRPTEASWRVRAAHTPTHPHPHCVVERSPMPYQGRQSFACFFDRVPVPFRDGVLWIGAHFTSGSSGELHNVPLVVIVRALPLKITFLVTRFHLNFHFDCYCYCYTLVARVQVYVTVEETVTDKMNCLFLF